MIIQLNFAGYFGTLGLVPFKVESFDGKVLAFHIVIIQTNGNSLLYLNKCQHLRKYPVIYFYPLFGRRKFPWSEPLSCCMSLCPVMVTASDVSLVWPPSTGIRSLLRLSRLRLARLRPWGVSCCSPGLAWQYLGDQCNSQGIIKWRIFISSFKVTWALNSSKWFRFKIYPFENGEVHLAWFKLAARERCDAKFTRE